MTFNGAAAPPKTDPEIGPFAKHSRFSYQPPPCRRSFSAASTRLASPPWSHSIRIQKTIHDDPSAVQVRGRAKLPFKSQRLPKVAKLGVSPVRFGPLACVKRPEHDSTNTL